MKVAVITCYFDPDYVRARTIRAGVKAYPGAQLIVVKNQHKGVLRYPEMIWKLIELRRKQRPDIYLLTFRGQEMLPVVLLVAGLKPVIFDEFIVPIAYATGENHRRSVGTSIKHFLARASEPLYKLWLRQCRVILADTEAHAELSARVSRVNLRQYRVLPVGTDEQVFTPTTLTKDVLITKPFQVFFYGLLMTPLQGVEVIYAAAEQLKDKPDIEFLIVGGNKQTARRVSELATQGVHITYKAWIPFEELQQTIHSSALCLGGPFGGTPQANHVIGTKEYQFLACAAPTVVGDSEVTALFFKDKENALVVPQADPEALAKAISWGALHRSELVDIGRAGRKLYEREFSSEVIAGEIKKLLDEVA